MAANKNEIQEELENTGIHAGDRYRHYKGGEYVVITCAIQEDSLEILVIYKSLANQQIWARTLKEWNQVVEYNGKQVKRFERIF